MTTTTLTLTEEQLYTLQAVLAHAGGEKADFEMGAAFDLFERVSRMVNRLEEQQAEAYADPTNTF